MVGVEVLPFELLPSMLVADEVGRGCVVTMTNFCCPPALPGVLGVRGVCPWALVEKKEVAEGVTGVEALPCCWITNC